MVSFLFSRERDKMHSVKDCETVRPLNHVIRIQEGTLRHC